MTQRLPSVRPPAAPRHLSKPAARLFLAVSRAFVMEPHDLAVLAKALEAWDRAEQARARIEVDGLMVTSRLGEPSRTRCWGSSATAGPPSWPACASSTSTTSPCSRTRRRQRPGPHDGGMQDDPAAQARS